MADQTTAPNTVPNSDKADAAPRNEGPDRLAQLRAKKSVEQHAAELAAKARVEEAERNLAASQARITEMEAVASKAATVEGAQRHELALVDRKHTLTLEQQRQQWALDDARKERDRQVIEADRERNAAAETQRVTEVRQQCDAISQQNVEMHAAISREENRINLNSAVVGGLLGLVGVSIGAANSRKRRDRVRGATPTLIGAGGLLTVAVPLVAPYLKPGQLQLPPPVTSTGWDAYLMAMTAENTRLRSQFATLQATKLSMLATAASAVGVGAITYAVSG